jgi:hypothetical protein
MAANKWIDSTDFDFNQRDDDDDVYVRDDDYKEEEEEGDDEEEKEEQTEGRRKESASLAKARHFRATHTALRQGSRRQAIPVKRFHPRKTDVLALVRTGQTGDLMKDSSSSSPQRIYGPMNQNLLRLDERDDADLLLFFVLLPRRFEVRGDHDSERLEFPELGETLKLRSYRTGELLLTVRVERYPEAIRNGAAITSVFCRRLLLPPLLN